MTTQPPSDAGNIRVGDAERTAVINRIGTAHSLGQLTLEELDERVRAAAEAKTVADLAALTADLPTQPAPRVGWGPRPADLDRYLAALRRGASTAWSRSAVRIALLIVALNVLVWAVLSIVIDNGGGEEHGDGAEGLYFWPIWVAVALGVPFVVEAVKRRRGRA